MASLYELDERMRIFETTGVDTDSGEVALSEEDFQRIFDEIDMDLKDKMINVACYIKNLQSDVEQFDAEIEKLKKRKQARINKAERLSNLLDYVAKHRINDVDEDFEATNKSEEEANQKAANKWKIDDPRAVISYRRSTKVDIKDEKVIPRLYKVKETVEKIDRKGILEALKQGKKVKGAELVDNLNLQIK